MYCYEVARIGKAVASPSRLLIIDSLYSGPLTVEAIADETGLTVANTSQHLQRLKDARLLESEKHGLQVTYRLAGPEVADFYDSLRKIAGKRLLEVQSIIEQFADDAQALDWVDFETLLERAKRGDVTVIDVRPREEYDSGHFPGALSVPLDELEKNAEKLPENIAEGFVRAYIGKRGKILGVDIAGEGSGEMINEWSLAMQTGSKIKDIMMTQHSFPTMGMMSKRIGENWVMQKLKSGTTRKLIRFLLKLP